MARDDNLDGVMDKDLVAAVDKINAKTGWLCLVFGGFHGNGAPCALCGARDEPMLTTCHPGFESILFCPKCGGWDVKGNNGKGNGKPKE